MVLCSCFAFLVAFYGYEHNNTSVDQCVGSVGCQRHSVAPICSLSRLCTRTHTAAGPSCFADIEKNTRRSLMILFRLWDILFGLTDCNQEEQAARMRGASLIVQMLRVGCLGREVMCSRIDSARE
jgi:hypothetical protein